MRPIVFVVPGDLSRISGGYAYAREVLRRAGSAMSLLSLPGGWPRPSQADQREAARRLAQAPNEAILLIDGLALGAMEPAILAPYAHRLVALTHHPLALEAGLSPERAAALTANERAVLALAARVIATSAVTAEQLARDYGVSRARLVVAEPGTQKAARAKGSGGPGLALLALGAVTPRKAYRDLVAALAGLKDRDWRLTIAGPLDADRGEVASLRADIARHDLVERVTLAGALNDAAREAAFARADLFVHAALWEGYGMALAEAMARGLPIVTTRAGAADRTAPDAAALKVAPGDVAALAQALARALDEAPLRASLAEASWRAGRALPDWDATTARILWACALEAER